MRNLAIIFSLLLAAGCGGSGGSSKTTPPPADPQTIVSGVVFASDTFSSGVVKAYDFSGGNKAGLIASAVINSTGAYQLTVPASSGAILIEVDSGCYNEKAIPWNAAVGQYPSAQNTVTASVCFTSPALSNEPVLSSAVIVPAGATTLVVAVTPYTHSAVGRAEYEIRNGTTTTTALSDANTILSQWVGVDILTTLPAAPVRSTTLSNATLYGSLLSGIPSWLLNVATPSPAVFGTGTLTTLAFADAMKSDLAQDGFLNGVGRNINGIAVALTVGNSAMTTTIYRHQLAYYATTRVRAETEGALNSTSEEQVRIVSFLPAFVAYNDAAPQVVDASPIVALDEGGPVVTIGGPSPGATLSGNDGMSGFVHDHVGISPLNTIIMVDGVKYTEVFNQYIPNHFINTTIFANGSHTLTIKATNNLGHVSTASVTVNFLN
jgi:hypothetical protein